MQQLRAKRLNAVLMIALLTTYVVGETELEVKIRNLRSEMKAFPNTTIAEMDERLTELEAEVIVLQETQLLQTEHIQALRDEIEDGAAATQILFTSLDALDDRTDKLENKDTQHDYEFDVLKSEIDTLKEVDTGLSSRMTTVEDIVDVLDEKTNGMEISVLQHDYEIDTLKEVDAGFSTRLGTVEDIVNAPLVSCQSDPCTNGATCIDVTADKFICSCHPGHYGPQCENSLNDVSVLTTFFFHYTDLAAGVMIFDDDRINPGNHYDPTTGYYTVPQDGTYEIYYQLSVEETHPVSFLVIDDVQYTGTVDYASITDTRSNPSYITTHLDEGQVVYVENGCGGCTTFGVESGHMGSWFGVNLIYAD